MREVHLLRTALIACPLIALSCSGEVTRHATGSTGGESTSVGGTNAATGGATSVAGNSNAPGGSTSTGGVSTLPNGGDTATAGMSATGGLSNPDSSATGGTTPAASSFTGGTPATGGTTATASSLTGGTPGTGGVESTGGIAGTGGVQGLGGTAPLGGTSSGGAPAAGGSSASTGGVDAIGGSNATGGSSAVDVCGSSGGSTIAAAGACSTSGPPIPSCVNDTPVTDQVDLFDDFEDCDTCIRPVGGRRGFWFRFDGSGWQVPERRTDTERGSRVLRAIGSTSSTSPYWGIAAWPNATTYCDETAVDLSQYSGISFWAKNVTGTAIKLTVRDDDTQFNTSNEGATSPTFVMSIGPTWTQYKVYFTDLKRPLDQSTALPSSIHIIKWEGAAAEAIYDLNLDDVAFFKD